MKQVQRSAAHIPLSSGAGAGAKRRFLLKRLAIAPFLLGASISTTSHAQTDAATVLSQYSEWTISHEGIFKETYIFRPNGTYDYRMRTGSEGQRESGTYSVRGDRLILTPTGKSTKSLRLRWTTDPYGKRPVLHLGYPDGREEFYYAMVY